MADLIEQLTAAAVGSRCEAARHEYSWSFRFEGKCWFMVECPWRIVDKSGIVFASQDDGHPFGLPAPVDGERKTNEKIGSRPLTSMAIDRLTADVTFSFDDGSRLDVFNNSMGYEGWHAGFETGHGEARIIGCGGGQIAMLEPQNGS